MALWNALAPAATVAQLVGADAAGLVSAILQAERGAVYGFVMAGRQAEQFREVQGEIDSYLLIFPMVSHIDVSEAVIQLTVILNVVQ
ncbi:hypothetical protein EJB05_55383, partial [Eragrostis curvula]